MSHQPKRPKNECAIDSQAMRARGIIVLAKSNQLVQKNIETKHLSQVKAGHQSFFAAKTLQISLLVGYNIQPTSSSTNQTAALIIDHQLDFTNTGKRAFAYSAAILFSCLDTDLKQIARVSPSSSIFSSRLNNFKHKLLILFLKFASNIPYLEELMCYDCRFSLYCNCIR